MMRTTRPRGIDTNIVEVLLHIVDEPPSEVGEILRELAMRAREPADRRFVTGTDGREHIASEQRHHSLFVGVGHGPWSSIRRQT